MRKGSLTVIMLGSLVGAAGCHKTAVRSNPPAAAKPAPAPVAPPPVPVPQNWPDLPLPPSGLSAPPEPLLPRDFRDGETNFEAGKFVEASRYYERYIQKDAVTQFRDKAIFRLGLCYTLACASAECRAKSMERSQEQFRQLVSRFPKSPYAAEARFILALQNDLGLLRLDLKARDEKIKQLTEELDRLKKIDLERKTPRIKK